MLIGTQICFIRNMPEILYMDFVTNIPEQEGYLLWDLRANYNKAILAY